VKIPPLLQKLVDEELRSLARPGDYSPSDSARRQIHAAFGEASAVGGSSNKLSLADHARARLSLLSARFILPLWSLACQETEFYFTKQDWSDKTQDERREGDYLINRQELKIERFSAFDVPRVFVPSHLVELAETALKNHVLDEPALHRQISEWWNCYGRPDRNEREFYIKWAAQDAVSEAVGENPYDFYPPAENALYAFAGIITSKAGQRQYRLDPGKRRQFWTWWLSEAIPQAFADG
jgi:hypothetical protein